MAIIFHCERCGKKIEAKDSVGGKWGKCPACHHKLYVPALASDEDLKLSPINESEEIREQKLMAETFELTEYILSEKELPPSLAGLAESEINEKDLTKNIILYLRQMADGELADAEKAVKLISSYHRQAEKIIDQLAVQEMPEPELADISRQVLSGLIRDLRRKIRK